MSNKLLTTGTTGFLHSIGKKNLPYRFKKGVVVVVVLENKRLTTGTTGFLQ